MFSINKVIKGDSFIASLITNYIKCEVQGNLVKSNSFSFSFSNWIKLMLFESNNSVSVNKNIKWIKL